MKHTVFALFENLNDTQKALAELHADTKCAGQVSVISHEGNFHNTDLEIHETAAKHEAAVGWALGATGGALLAGLVAGPIGLVGGGALFAILVGGTTGGVLGALQGFLAGSSSADPRLEQIAHKVESEQNVLISVVVDTLECEEHVEKIFAKHGASETHRNFV